MAPLLALEAVGKSFFGVTAVEDVTLDVEEGRVLGLIGENGAGKSTLMNIVGGVLAPSTGRMRLASDAYEPRTVAEATAGGIAFIHQELNLFGNLSVAENIFIDGFPRRFGLIDRSAIRRRTRELLATLEVQAAPDTTVAGLSPGERQLVEIARALHRDARLIIFDEPTTSLTARETDKLFATIERLRAQGRTMIYISHILGDVRRLADSIAVLRDGALVDAGPAAAFDIARMIRSMIGRELTQLFPERRGAPLDEVLLDVQGVCEPGIVSEIGFQVRRGEVVGLFGLMGSGRSELARILFGLDGHAAGTVTLAGAELGRHDARRSIAAGMAFVTENRREEGLMMEATIVSNLTLVALDQLARGPLRVVARDDLERTARTAVDELHIRADDIAAQPAKSLSGGNQQKVVLGKWLLKRPVLFLLDEPTRGVDVGAKHEIYGIINALADAGNGVLFISSELEELIGIADRILVMSQGELRAAFDRRPFRAEPIMRAAFREEAA